MNTNSEFKSFCIKAAVVIGTVLISFIAAVGVVLLNTQALNTWLNCPLWLGFPIVLLCAVRIGTIHEEHSKLKAVPAMASWLLAASYSLIELQSVLYVVLMILYLVSIRLMSKYKVMAKLLES